MSILNKRLKWKFLGKRKNRWYISRKRKLLFIIVTAILSTRKFHMNRPYERIKLFWDSFYLILYFYFLLSYFITLLENFCNIVFQIWCMLNSSFAIESKLRMCVNLAFNVFEERYCKNSLLHARHFGVCSEKLRKFYSLGPLFGFGLFESHEETTMTTTTRFRRESRSENRVSRLSRSAEKTRGRTLVWLRPEAHNSASPFLSFVPFVHSFVHRENSRAWTVRRATGRPGKNRECSHYAYHRYPRSAKCAIFSIQDSKPLWSDEQAPILSMPIFREKKCIYIYILSAFLSTGLSTGSVLLRLCARYSEFEMFPDRNCIDFDSVDSIYNHDPWN